MNRLVASAFAASFLLLSACASRTDREALRYCAFAPVGVHRTTNISDSMVISLDLEIRNPGPSVAILDSFQATAFANKPFAHFCHGKARRIEAGHADTATLRFSMAKHDLLATAFTFMVAPPDSIGLEGTAWIPSLFGLWTSEQRFKTRIPFQAVSARMNEILRSSAPSP
jgi:hypothetical protein